MIFRSFLCSAAACLVLACSAVFAQSVEVQSPWARATVPGQTGSGAFMKFTASSDTTLISVSSPVAGVVQVHEMKMDGDVMKMRPLEGGLLLPAGKLVELKPGGYHIMLMDLKSPLVKGTTISLSLVFRDSKGIETRTELKVPVSAMAPMAPMAHMDH